MTEGENAMDGATRRRSKTLWCLVDEAGSLSRSEKEPFRVGFPMTCRPERMQEDIRRLKRELPPRGKSGECPAKEDDSVTRAMIRALLCLNRKPQMHIVEWQKDEFPESAFFPHSLPRLRRFQPADRLVRGHILRNRGGGVSPAVFVCGYRRGGDDARPVIQPSRSEAGPEPGVAGDVRETGQD
jgi:hypothetical protein